MPALFFAIGYDPSRFFANLSTGDPIAWLIMAGIVGFSLFSVYQCMPLRN